ASVARQAFLLPGNKPLAIHFPISSKPETAGEVYATETPAGEAAVAVHRGPYERMHETYTAIEQWLAANQRESAGQSWEIYGDPTPDPAKTETTIVHLLK